MQLFYYQSFYESFEGSVLWEQVTGEEFGSKKLWGGAWTSKYEYQNINWMVKLEIKRIILMKPLVSWMFNWMFNDTHRGREPEAILIKKRVADWQSWLIWLHPSSSISFSSFLSPFSKPSFSFFSSFFSLLPFLPIFSYYLKKSVAEWQSLAIWLCPSSLPPPPPWPLEKKGK